MFDSIDNRRVTMLGDESCDSTGKYVLYWMQRSHRTHHNDALEYAIQLANVAKSPLLVVAVIPGQREVEDGGVIATKRQTAFMIEGLRDVAESLSQRDIGFTVLTGDPIKSIAKLAGDAVAVITDQAHLRHEKAWRQQLSDQTDRRTIAIESDLIVPIEAASDKQEYAARTLRPKIYDRVDDFLKPLSQTEVDKAFRQKIPEGVNLKDSESILSSLDLDTVADPVPQHFGGGQRAAEEEFEKFLGERLGSYDEHRSHPETDHVSHVSKYLHFGHVSPVWLALKIQSKRGNRRDDKDSFLEELIVRRELAYNYVFYCNDYDNFHGLPDWAQETLQDHKDDDRPKRFTRQQLESGETDDPYWNAAMKQLRETGYMHNHMRMYWGKKILEYSGTPKYAHRTTLLLNNRYFLDGNDANSFANVGWIYGLHDRGWNERDVFGKVRYMNQKGLERKCDPEAYVKKVNGLVKEPQ